MVDAHTSVLFLATALVLVLCPGPDTVLVVSRTLASGTRAGLATLLGTQAGNMLHALLAGIGVSGLILLFPPAFTALKYAGAAYLLSLAVITWRAKGGLDLHPRLTRQGSFARFFRQGLASNLTNAKMIPFFIALFPQFVHADAGPAAVQSLILGATLAGLALVWLGLLAVVIGRFRANVTANPRIVRVVNRFAAITFFGLACRVAIQEPR